MNSPLDQTALALSRALRPKNILTSVLLFCAAYLIGCGFHPSVYILIAGACLVTFAQGIVTIHNDISDRAIDRANRRSDIPLANNAVSPQLLLQYALFLVVVCTLIAASIGTFALLWLSVYLLLGWCYSGPPALKNRPIASLVILGVCYGSMPWLLAIIAGQTIPNLTDLAFVAGSGLFSAGIVSLKDFKDMKGDKKYHKRTFLLRFGESGVRWLIVGTTVAATGIIAATVWNQTLVVVTLIASAVTICIVALRSDLQRAIIRKRVGYSSRVIFFSITLTAFLFTPH